MLGAQIGIGQYSANHSLLLLGCVQNLSYVAQNGVLYHQKPSCHQHRLKPLKLKNDQSEDSDYLTTTVERVSSLFAAPTPGITPGLALGYPFLLTMAFLFLPMSSAAFLLSFFAAFSLAGRKLVLEDYLEEQNDATTPEEDVEADDFLDKPPTDLLAMGASILCTALVAPNTAGSSSILNVDEIPVVGVIMTLLFAFLTLGVFGEQTAEAASPEKELMDIWDEQLASQAQEKAENDE